MVGENNVYFSVNTQHHPRNFKTKYGIPMALQKEANTLFLNACFVGLGIYRLKGEMDVDTALSKIKELQESNVIPPVSIYTLSGRGIYLIWLLKSRKNKDLPPMSHDGLIKKYKLLNKELQRRLKELAADDKTGSASQVFRLPGSVNCKSGREVDYAITPYGGKICEYTIDELMNFLEIRDIEVAKASKGKIFCGLNTKKKVAAQILSDMKAREERKKLNERIDRIIDQEIMKNKGGQNEKLSNDIR